MALAIDPALSAGSSKDLDDEYAPEKRTAVKYRRDAMNDGHHSRKKQKVKVGPRASIACQLCRKRKIRCSGEYPTCTFCDGKGTPCVYDVMPPPRVHPSLQEIGLSPPSGEETGASPVDASCLPPLNVQFLAFNAFFEHFVDAGLYTFIHRSSMAEAIGNGKAPLELVLAIMALSARFEPHLADLFESHQAASKYYASKALAIIRADPDAATLSRLQALLMLALHDCTEGHESRGWILLGVAVRLCSILRLARYEPPDDGVDGPSSVKGAPKTALDSEIRRRTYWSAFLLDRLMCDGHERLSMLRIDPYGATIRMPRSDDDFEAGNWALTARFEHTVPVWARTDESARRVPIEPEADLLGQTLRISDIWSQVVSYVGAGGHNIDRRAPWSADSTFAKLDASIRHWYDTLPDHVKYNESNRVAHAMVGKGQLFALVHLIYHACLLYLHRDYIPFVPPQAVYDPASGVTDGQQLILSSPPPKDFWLHSTSIAFHSANAITDLVQSVNGGFAGGSLLGHPFVGFAVLTAGTMHSHLHWFSVDRSPRHQEYVVADAQILDRYRSYWSVAAQWCRGLGLIYDIYGNHRDIAAFSTPHPAPMMAAPPWARTRDDIMRIVPQSEDDIEQRGSIGEINGEIERPIKTTLDSGSNSRQESSNGMRVGRKRYDLFALINDAGVLRPEDAGAAPTSPLFMSTSAPNIDTALSDYWPILETDDTDPFALNSFTDWALNGLGGGNSWWLNISP